MRVVTLSDHAAEQIQKAQDLRADVNDRLMADWRAAVGQHEATIAGHAAGLRQAWAQRRVMAVVAIFFNWLCAWLSSQPTMPALQGVSPEEGRFQGGQEGEARVLTSLSRLFDDQWIAFKGYFNRGGETDLLLVGPTAVVALEVKYRNGVVHCEGSNWTCDKSDKYGNVVERGLPVRDAKGRSPGQQVNATADGLQTQLAHRGLGVPVRRAVILAHDASRIGRVHEPGVEFIGVLADHAFHSKFLALVQPPPGRPDFDVAALEHVVRRDHEFHTRAKAQRAATPSMSDPSAAISSALASSAPTTAEPPVPQALARPRPVRLMPPSVDASQLPSDLERRQAEALGNDIAALHRSHGSDKALERQVRLAISGHLQNGSRFRVLTMAIGLRRPDERALMDRLVRECRQVVELEDRTLHAIVVPLAVRWEVPEGSDWSDVWINSVGSDGLQLPALLVGKALGVEKVVFGNRLYEGRILQSLDARLLRQALMQVEAGADPVIPELKPALIAPSPAVDWRIVHLLAVAVTAPNEPLRLDDDARRSLAGQHAMIESSLTLAALEATGTPQAAQAHAEGVWTLADGVQHGHGLQRRHALEKILAAGPTHGTTDRPPLRCWYTTDGLGLSVRLLIDWGSIRVEREFSMYGEEQPLIAVRGLLDAAIAARVPPGTSIRVEQLDLHDYRRQLQALGMSWIGQGHGHAGSAAGREKPARRPPRPRPSADPTARSPGR